MPEVKIYNSFKTSQWTGGTTTELFIWPENSDFKSGNFKVRISTATVEIEESIFTKLPKIDRTLVVLDGHMKLEHSNHHQKDLTPFEMDSFSGDWETKSIGKCTDFNLMTKGGIKSKISIVHLKGGKQEKVVLNVGQHFFYNYHESITLIHNEEYKIDQKYLTQVTIKTEAEELSFFSEANCRLVHVQIGIGS